jgi:hypothetical protein
VFLILPETFGDKGEEVLIYGGDKGELRGAPEGEPADEGAEAFRIISSKRIWAAGLSLSDFKATAASPRVASFRTVALDGEGLRSTFAIEASKALIASSLLPESNDARP